MRRIVGAAAAAMLVVAGGAEALAEQPVRVPGTSVTLVPPAGFSPAVRYPGFEHPDLHASIMVSELPGSAAVMQRGLTTERLASRGMRLLGSSRHVVDGREALLLHVEQEVNGDEVRKWMLVAGNENGTVMIVATVPEAAEDVVGEAARISLLTMTTASGREGRPDHFEGLPFRVSPTDRLKIAGRVSNLLVLTESGAIRSQGRDACVFVVGSSLADVRVTDLRAFAEKRLRETEQVADVRNVEGRERVIGGLPAYEIVAAATDPATGRMLTLYQVLLQSEATYILMQGLVVQARASEMVPEFQRVAASFAAR